MLAPVFAALMAAGLVSMGGFWFYHAIARGGSDVTRRAQTSALFDQAAYALSAESLDADADGYREPPAFTANASFTPTGGGIIPAASHAPRLDGWGRQIGYCPYDNGTGSVGGNLIAGDNPGTTASVAFALITAGANGQYETACVEAKAGTANGDDGIRFISETAQKQLAGGLSIGTGAYWKPAVANAAALPAGTVSGEVRVTLDNGAINQWNGAIWATAVASAGGGGATMWAGSATDSSSLGACSTDGNVLYSLADYFFWKCSAPAGLAWQAEDLPLSGGTLWAWGRNAFGELGLGTSGAGTERSSPVQVGALANWKQVAMGVIHTAAIKSDGTLWSWGYNYNGQLGSGTTTARSSPVQVGLLTNWAQVAAGMADTVAIKSDGTLWTWGRNAEGQLGDGTTNNRSSPAQVGTLTNWKQAAAGYTHSVAVKNDGTLWVWGFNTAGQLGDGTTNDRSSPVQVAGTNWKVAAAGYAHTLAIKIDGTLWAWGSNSFGQLGQGNTSNYSSPVQLGALTNWKQVAGGDTHSVAIKTDGTLWAWGKNDKGQLGYGNTSNYSSPLQVGALTNWKQVNAGHHSTSTAAVKTDGTLWTWGENDIGQLGQGNSGAGTNLSLPVQVGALNSWKQTAGAYRNFFAIQSDNPSNVIVGSPTVPERVYAGTLWAWGRNAYGDLGLGTFGAGTERSSPVQVGALTNWKQVAMGMVHTAAIKSDGTLWTWGYNYSGQLGSGTTTARSSPVQVGALTNWAQVAVEATNTAAIKSDGTLWTWGYNYQGQLGDGTTTARSSPAQVGTLTNWKQSAAGYLHNVAVKNDGTLWAWGYKGDGRLGDGTTTNRSSPVQVGGLTNWKEAAAGYGHTLAIKTDGTLWAWGKNNNGQLGLGNTSNRSSPVQVGTLTNWKQAAGGYTHSVAIKTDGTLWAWGKNDKGQLGYGNTTNYSSPVQVGALSNWKQVNAGHRSTNTAAVKTDGTLWTWGENDIGQLGQGNSGAGTNLSLPVQVGALSTWGAVTGSYKSIMALQPVTCLEYCY